MKSTIKTISILVITMGGSGLVHTNNAEDFVYNPSTAWVLMVTGMAAFLLVSLFEDEMWR